MKVRLIFLMGFLCSSAMAQTILEKRISLDVSQKSVYFTLAQIEKEGDFVFSYNSSLVPKDSMVSVKANGSTVAEVLEELFRGRYSYIENRKFLIINPSLRPLNIITTDASTDQQSYSISGLVVDGISGERLMNVSVYEKQQLVAALTDEHGYFKLKFKAGMPQTLTVTASKLLYKDVSVNFLQSVSITAKNKTAAYKQAAENSRGVQGDPLGEFFISARQRIQSLNIPDFFASKPFQVSLTPGLSTHGLLTSQVINKFSLNLAGGYTAGVNGVEAGGLFNINRVNSKYVQLAGVFNLVGGNVTGLQLAGVNNRVLDSVKGVQLAGFVNKAEGQVSGVQIAALNNEARKLKGLQIGLVNVVDTSEGASIGLINIIRNGFYKVSLSSNNVFNTNISLTTGTHKFYTAIHAGANLTSGTARFGFGLGAGHDFLFGDKFFLAAVADYQIYGNGGNFLEHWKQGKLLLNAQLNKNIGVFAGPSFTRSTYRTAVSASAVVPPANVFTGNRHYRNRFGWEAGIAFNSVFKPAKKITYKTQSWYLGAAALGGIDLKSTDAIAGAQLFTERKFDGSLSAILSVGYIQHYAQVRKDLPKFEPGMFYLNYFERKDLQTLPVKAGMKTYVSKRLFFTGEVGVMPGLNNPNYDVVVNPDNSRVSTSVGKAPSSFIAAASVGYTFSGGLETGVNYDDYSGLDIQLMTVHLAYRFKLSN